jgi:hypothetical protein
MPIILFLSIYYEEVITERPDSSELTHLRKKILGGLVARITAIKSRVEKGATTNLAGLQARIRGMMV